VIFHSQFHFLLRPIKRGKIWQEGRQGHTTEPRVKEDNHLLGLEWDCRWNTSTHPMGWTYSSFWPGVGDDSTDIDSTFLSELGLSKANNNWNISDYELHRVRSLRLSADLHRAVRLALHRDNFLKNMPVTTECIVRRAETAMAEQASAILGKRGELCSASIITLRMSEMRSGLR
jgi:hypothetical protein